MRVRRNRQTFDKLKAVRDWHDKLPVMSGLAQKITTLRTPARLWIWTYPPMHFHCSPLDPEVVCWRLARRSRGLRQILMRYPGPSPSARLKLRVRQETWEKSLRHSGPLANTLQTFSKRCGWDIWVEREFSRHRKLGVKLESKENTLHIYIFHF